MVALERQRPRNERWVDWWSLTHVAWGAALALAIGPFWALVLMTLWEPFEVLLVSPLVARFGASFGHESLVNSLVDLVFNVAGVLLGAALAGILGWPSLAAPWP